MAEKEDIEQEGMEPEPAGSDESALDATQGNGEDDGGDGMSHVKPVTGMYREWFLDYASYVILERAVPSIYDGLKPVQRRLLHALKELDDGRYHKCANVIGHTMKYHPHGDASIGDALVQLGQKELLVDTQGNWGNILTGDGAAAPRYIEARLTKFALEVVFNAKTTEWQASYDGRAKEPVALPVKFPLLLTQGAEGIAVGLSTKILPHNFNELIDASIKILKGKKAEIFPDFPTGGSADFSQYNDGKRGGKVRVRAKIKQEDKKTLVITEVPFGTTTSSLIDSVIKANDKGKIKIRKIEDNTADKVEIMVHLPAGVSPDKMIDALYAFTDCEISISPNACVIENDIPRFLGVSEMLKNSTEQTLALLKQELEIRLGELNETWHFASLEKIFIENRIYRKIEECETWEAVIEAIHKGLKPHVKHLKRKVTDDDVVRLTEIKIKRISKYNSFKADEAINKLEEEIKAVNHDLENLVDYAVAYFKQLKEKYGEGRERKTEIKSFENIVANKVAVANAKLYVNREEGFVGHSLKRSDAEYVCDCSDIDDIIVIRKDGKMLVSRISGKAFFGKDILHVGVWKKNDTRTIYNLIYLDGQSQRSMVKRFAVNSITRDREYDLTKGTAGSKITYLTTNPNGEAETITVVLSAKAKLKKIKFDFDFKEIAVKGRAAAGNILTKHRVSKILLKEAGVSTLGARKIWYDESVQRLNADGRGVELGDFGPNDRVLTIMESGEYLLTGFDLFTKFEEDMVIIEKWNPKKPISAIYYDGEQKRHYVKRFLVEPSGKKVSFISEHEESKLSLVTVDWAPQAEVIFSKVKGKEREPERVNVMEFIDVKGLKARGNVLTKHAVRQIKWLEPLPFEPEEEPTDMTAVEGETGVVEEEGSPEASSEQAVDQQVESVSAVKTKKTASADSESGDMSQEEPVTVQLNGPKEKAADDDAEATQLGLDF